MVIVKEPDEAIMTDLCPPKKREAVMKMIWNIGPVGELPDQHLGFILHLVFTIV